MSVLRRTFFDRIQIVLKDVDENKEITKNSKTYFLAVFEK